MNEREIDCNKKVHYKHSIFYTDGEGKRVDANGYTKDDMRVFMQCALENELSKEFVVNEHAIEMKKYALSDNANQTEINTVNYYRNEDIRRCYHKFGLPMSFIARAFELNKATICDILTDEIEIDEDEKSFLSRFRNLKKKEGK